VFIDRHALANAYGFGQVVIHQRDAGLHVLGGDHLDVVVMEIRNRGRQPRRMFRRFAAQALDRVPVASRNQLGIDIVVVTDPQPGGGIFEQEYLRSQPFAWPAWVEVLEWFGQKRLRPAATPAKAATLLGWYEGTRSAGRPRHYRQDPRKKTLVS